MLGSKISVSSSVMSSLPASVLKEIIMLLPEIVTALTIPSLMNSVASIEAFSTLPFLNTMVLADETYSAPSKKSSLADDNATVAAERLIVAADRGSTLPPSSRAATLSSRSLRAPATTASLS